MTRRGFALLGLLVTAIAACGHYGPPVRAAKVKSDAAATTPAADTAPAPDPEKTEKHD